MEGFEKGRDLGFIAAPDKRLERTRHKRASLVSCVGEPLKPSVGLLRKYRRVEIMNGLITERFVTEIAPHLTAEDDVNLWRVAFDAMLADIETLYPDRTKKHELFLQVGACSHWLRPHQMTWTKGGGFAWPEGYLQKYRDHIKNSSGPIGSGLPELDWFVVAHWNRGAGEWEMVAPKFFGKKKLVFRAAIPTRSRRHMQAAIHTVWIPGSPEDTQKKVTRFYGFRKRDESWKCVAASN
jgi:hypothetical protein